LYFHLSSIPFQSLTLLSLCTFSSLFTVPFPWTPFHKLMYITCGKSRKFLIYSLQGASEGYAIGRFLCLQHY
jgi:hypothetical protein